ncbi:MAG: hypothetical protein JXK94_01615 [Deltaproteobacteria bacterium]|nr:hypothetical protein [Deltaproteobacteria bacterium]
MKKHNFLKAIDTLKLYRRAELLDEEGHRLIKDLYVDPFPDEHVLKTILRPNTTFLIGRKGTGKSTIFQRAQETLDTNKKCTWAYIDIKTIFESSTSEILGHIPTDSQTSLTQESIKKIFIFRGFVVELVKEIRQQIQQRVKSNIWSRIKEAFTGSVAELFENLDEFIAELESDNFINITGNFQSQKNEEKVERKGTKLSGDISLDIT